MIATQMAFKIFLLRNFKALRADLSFKIPITRNRQIQRTYIFTFYKIFNIY